MKKFFMLILALLMLCGCNVQEEPIEPSLDETLEPNEEANSPELFDENAFDSMEFIDKKSAYIYDFNLYYGIENEEFIESTVMKYDFSAKSGTLLPRNFSKEAFESEGETDYLYTGNEVLSIKNGEIVSSYIVENKYSSFCRKNGALVFSPENNIVKMMKPGYSEAETVFEYPAAEHEFIANTAISPDGRKILLDICYYEAMFQEKVLCITDKGEVLFEIDTHDFEGLYDFFWLSEDEFALDIYIDDEEKSIFEIFGVGGELRRKIEFPSYVDGICLPKENYPFGIIHCRYPDVFYLMNFKDGNFEEIYSAPKEIMIRTFDISPDGKTFYLVENGELKTVEIPERPVPETYINILKKFEATDLQEIQLFSDNGAYIYAFNRDVDFGDGFKTTVSCMELKTGETEILFDGSAYFEYGDMLFVHEMPFSNPWIFTGKDVFSKGIADGPDTYYFLDGRPFECDFDFGNKRFIYIDGNDKSKLYSRNIETGEEKLLFDVSGEGEHRFIHDPKVNSNTGNIIFMDCNYSASVPMRLICIDFYGNVIFEESFEESFSDQMRWLTDEKFALFVLDSDELTCTIKIYSIKNGLESEMESVFTHNIQNDITKSYPYAVTCEYLSQSYLRYRLWLHNFEDGSIKELYTSPTKGVIHGFDLSPSGKTLCWIENNDIKYMEIK